VEELGAPIFCRQANSNARGADHFWPRRGRFVGPIAMRPRARPAAHFEPHWAPPMQAPRSPATGGASVWRVIGCLGARGLVSGARVGAGPARARRGGGGVALRAEFKMRSHARSASGGPPVGVRAAFAEWVGRARVHWAAIVGPKSNFALPMVRFWLPKGASKGPPDRRRESGGHNGGWRNGAMGGNYHFGANNLRDLAARLQQICASEARWRL